MYKIKFSLYAIILLIGIVNCWPNYILFNLQNTNGSIIKNDVINGSAFDISKKTRIIVHGFNENGTEAIFLRLIKALLFRKDTNVIVVEWTAQAIGPLTKYPIAVQNSKTLGAKLANFIMTNNISAPSVYCIGHSLGAHVCGYAGKYLNPKLGRITGLDPAAPLIDDNNPAARLDVNDATFVDIIHTSIIGMQNPIGLMDFYPNGGLAQPGCPSISDGGDCNHWRSVEFFTNSTSGQCNYMSVKCTDYFNFEAGNCGCNSTLQCPYMGYDAYLYNVEGSYYLDTFNTTDFCNEAMSFNRFGKSNMQLYFIGYLISAITVYFLKF